MFRFHQKECRIPLEIRISLSIYRLQLEGIRDLPNPALINDAFPSLTTRIQLSKSPPFSFDGVEFEPLELAVMEAARSERALGDLMREVGGDREPVERAVYGLLCAGIVQNADPGGGPMRVEEETGNFLLSPLSNQDNECANKRSEEEILRAFAEVQNGASALELLGLGGAPVELDVRRAFAMRIAEWDRKGEQLDPNGDLKSKVDAIKVGLETAKLQLLESFAPSTPSPSQESDARSDVQRLVSEIDLARMKNNTEKVITFLYELIRVKPNKAECELHLAKTLSEHPSMKKKAESHFRRASSLNAQNAEAHFLLGRYYQSFDLKNVRHR